MLQAEQKYVDFLTPSSPTASPRFPSSPVFPLSSQFWRASASMRTRASSSWRSRKSRSSRCFSRHTAKSSKRSFIIRLVWRRDSAQRTHVEFEEMQTVLTHLFPLTLQVSVLLNEDVHLMEGFLQHTGVTGRMRALTIHHGASSCHYAERMPNHYGHTCIHVY